MPRPSPEEQIQFLVKIQRLFDEGGFVATYKFALLQALIDLSVEKGDELEKTSVISTREIAQKYITYYWRQSIPFSSPSGSIVSVLRQNTDRQAAVINILSDANKNWGGSLPRLIRDKRAWWSTVSKIDKVVRGMPLARLQTVGREELKFLYEISADGKSITLLPGVAYNLRTFRYLIQDLIQGAWVRHIRSIRENEKILGQSRDLHEFLFGSEREPLVVYRRFLKGIQSGKCFYCQKNISDAGDVDHFIPWVKYPVDLGHNFVLAHSSCNNSKRDYLAAENHLENWFERNDRYYDDLTQFFNEKGIIHDWPASKQITCWAYEQAASASGHVWVLGKETQPIGQSYIDWRNLCGRGAVAISLAADD